MGPSTEHILLAQIRPKRSKTEMKMTVWTEYDVCQCALFITFQPKTQNLKKNCFFYFFSFPFTAALCILIVRLIEDDKLNM